MSHQLSIAAASVLAALKAMGRKTAVLARPENDSGAAFTVAQPGLNRALLAKDAGGGLPAASCPGGNTGGALHGPRRPRSQRGLRATYR